MPVPEFPALSLPDGLRAAVKFSLNFRADMVE